RAALSSSMPIRSCEWSAIKIEPSRRIQLDRHRMPDLLVKLYELKDHRASLPAGVEVRRAFAAEKRSIATWVSKQFSGNWASECEVAFARQPVACFIATKGNDVLGFAVYDATARGFFGPTGVAEESRHKGIGSVLLNVTLKDMAAKGYAYAIIGSTKSIE